MDYARATRAPLLEETASERWSKIGWRVAAVVFLAAVWTGVVYGVDYYTKHLMAVAEPVDPFADLRRQQLEQIRQLQQALDLAQHQNADLKAYNAELRKMVKAKNREVIP